MLELRNDDKKHIVFKLSTIKIKSLHYNKQNDDVFNCGIIENNI